MNHSTRTKASLLSAMFIAVCGSVPNSSTAAGKPGQGSKHPSHMAVGAPWATFEQGALTNNQYPLGTGPRAKLLSTTYSMGSSPWETHALVTLTKIPEVSGCKDSSNTSNQSASKVFIQSEDASNPSAPVHLYLINKTGVLDRTVITATVTSTNGTKELLFLQANSVAGEADAYDYFVEFVDGGNTSNGKIKRYRIEAFPHFVVPVSPPGSPPPVLDACAKERPDVQFQAQLSPQMVGVKAPSRPTDVTMYEASTGEGNEPNH